MNSFDKEGSGQSGEKGLKMGFIPIWELLSGSIESWILLVRNRHQSLIGHSEKPKSAVLKKVAR